MKQSILYYSVGPLLYCPANNGSIAASLTKNKFGSGYSLALCLEDTIGDSHVSEAEQTLVQSLKALSDALLSHAFYLPDIFIRVRNAEQIPRLMSRLENAGDLVKGFIFPKFSPENADSYIQALTDVNRQYHCQKYMMPIMESPSIIPLSGRAGVLDALKDSLDSVEELVLNIRVGGNDLCHIFGFRRHSNESIHRIRPIDSIFSDIVTVFGTDYVISGPVWEYYDGAGWDTGLIEELQGDRLCGFIGKTVIHPKQIGLVNEAYKVTEKDLEDAKAILNWDSTSGSLVSGSVGKERMNEQKTHSNWARQILFLSEAYGVKSKEQPNPN